MPLSRFDHVILGGPDLSALAKAFRALGFTLTPKGVHAGKGTANHCVMFAATYVELLGIDDPAAATGRLAEAARSRSGGLGVVYGGAADEARAHLDAAGLGPDGPHDLSRPLTLDGVTDIVRFRNVLLPKHRLSPLLQFVCEHVTPQLTRARHEWELHANGVVALTEIVLAVPDVAAAADEARALFGADRVSQSGEKAEARLDIATLVYLTPEAAAARYGTALGPVAPPAIAGLTLAVNEPDAASTMWDVAGVPYTELPGGALRVPAKSAGGVVLELVER